MPKVTTLHIPLTQGLLAQIDVDDLEIILPYSWHAVKPERSNTFYARANAIDANGKMIGIYMHRLIFSAAGDCQIDHINNDGLDNRRSNLRFATTSGQVANTKKRPSTSSRFKGVHWDRRDRKWRAQIVHDGQHIRLGRFTDEIAAAQAYDMKARELFGEFALTNF